MNLIGIQKCLVTGISWVLLALMFSFSTGCSKTVSESSSQSDANGFLCPSCGEKFFTSVKVFPSYCPKCKKTDLVEVVGYVASDGQVILAPRDQIVSDPKTKKPIRDIKLPRERELLAWGAVKRSAKETGDTR